MKRVIAILCSLIIILTSCECMDCNVFDRRDIRKNYVGGFILDKEEDNIYDEVYFTIRDVDGKVHERIHAYTIDEDLQAGQIIEPREGDEGIYGEEVDDGPEFGEEEY